MATKANYDIKLISAVGPGLIAARTGTANHFTVYTGYTAAVKSANTEDPRDLIDFVIEGPSEPGPLRFSNNDGDGSMDVTYTPLLQGDYKMNVLYNGNHIKGSPYSVRVTGESIKAMQFQKKVHVTGPGLKIGKVNVDNHVHIDTQDKAVAGGLVVSIAGPREAKANLVMDDKKDGTFKITYNPNVPGNYLLHVKLAESEVPGSPFSIKVQK